MPSTAMPSASLSVISLSWGWACAELGRAAAYVVGQQQLAARRRPQPIAPLVHRALVGDGEAADLVDLVAEELHAQRVLLGRREDVDDAAAHGELATLLDQVDAGVRRTDQPADDVVELELLARTSSTGSRSASP